MYETWCCNVKSRLWEVPKLEDGPRVADWVINTMPRSPFDQRGKAFDPLNPRHPYDIDHPPFTGRKRPYDMYPPPTDYLHKRPRYW